MKIKINLRTVSLYILLLVGCLRWFFEGVVGGYTWQIIFLAIGLIILFSVNKITLNHMNFEWLLFLAGIFISMIFGARSTSFSIMGRFIVVFLIILYAICCNYKPERCRNCINFIMVAAIIYAVLIIIQFFIGERFNNLFFPLLRQSSLEVARTYYNAGYVYGIFFTPADPAGLLMFTISFLILGGVIKYRINNSVLTPDDSLKQSQRTGNWILTILLFVPLLSTGKRGILICGISTLAVILALHYINKGQWYKVIGLVVILIAVFLIFLAIIIAFPDNPLFQRFIQLINSLLEGGLEGGLDDSGRGQLYRLAEQLWSDHKMFGIGWRQFSNMTVSVYGYSRAHEVNNEYLQFLCETGIVGTILILTPIIITLRRTIVVCFHYEKDPNIGINDKYMAYAASFIQIFTLIYAMIETPFCDVMFFTIYIFSVIVINGCYKQIYHSQQKQRKHLKIQIERSR